MFTRLAETIYQGHRPETSEEFPATASKPSVATGRRPKHRIVVFCAPDKAAVTGRSVPEPAQLVRAQPRSRRPSDGVVFVCPVARSGYGRLPGRNARMPNDALTVAEGRLLSVVTDQASNACLACERILWDSTSSRLPREVAELSARTPK